MKLVLSTVSTLATFFVCACSERAIPIPAGTYSFASSDLQESLTLKADGSFTQDIKIAGADYHADGTWTHYSKSNRIELRSSFLVRFDTQNGASIDPPQKYSYYVGYWQPARGKIVFDEDGHYYLTYISATTPDPKPAQ